MYFEYANFELIFKLKIAILSINCVCYMKCNMRSRIRQRLNAAQSGTSPKGLACFFVLILLIYKGTLIISKHDLKLSLKKSFFKWSETNK
jgi:hypothetical protein